MLLSTRKFAALPRSFQLHKFANNVYLLTYLFGRKCQIFTTESDLVLYRLLNNLFIILVPPDFLFTGCSVWLKYSSGKCKNILRTVMKMSRKCNSTRFPINHIYSRLLRVTIFFQIPTIFLNLQFRFTFTLFYHSAF